MVDVPDASAGPPDEADPTATVPTAPPRPYPRRPFVGPRKPMVARKSRVPPWLRTLTTRLWSVVPEDARPGVARFGPWLLCAALGFGLGHAVAGRSLRSAGTVPERPKPAAAAAPEAPLPAVMPVPRPAGCAATITTEPSGATVEWGELVLGQTPIHDMRVPCGKTFVTIRRARYQSILRSLAAATGEPLALHERLRRPEAEITIVSRPAGAHIRVNGQDAGDTSQKVQLAQFENAQIEVSAPGYQDWTKKVPVESATQTIKVQLRRRIDASKSRGKGQATAQSIHHKRK